MPTDFELGSKKIIDLTVETARLTSDVLKNAMKEFLYDKAQKKGKVSVGTLAQSANGGKLESIEVTDNNIRDFLSTAKKYDVDFAIKRDKSADKTVYHVFFAAAKTGDMKRAFSEYATGKQKEIAASDRGEISRKQLKEQAKRIEQQQRQPKEKVRERANEVSR